MNGDIKEAMRKSGIRQWQVASEIGISEATIVRWMRKELSQEQRKAILSAIEALSRKGE